jgi:ATP-binding cassette subfamily B protein RaxB
VLAAESAKSAEAAQGDDDCSDDCSDDSREGDYSKRAGKDDYSRDGKGDYSKHEGGRKDAKNDDCQPQKDYCEPKPSDNGGKRDSYRNPGEALAKIDFSRW